jgi:hypothetical protein
MITQQHERLQVEVIWRYWNMDLSASSILWLAASASLRDLLRPDRKAGSAR